MQLSQIVSTSASTAPAKAPTQLQKQSRERLLPPSPHLERTEVNPRPAESHSGWQTLGFPDVAQPRLPDVLKSQGHSPSVHRGLGMEQGHSWDAGGKDFIPSFTKRHRKVWAGREL